MIKKADFQDSGIEWTCKSPAESPPLTESGWPSFKPQTIKQPHLPSVQELASVEANRVQQHALKAVSEYLKYSIDAEDNDNDDEDDDSEEEDVMEVEKVDKEEKNVSFFAKLFEEDGEFSCLVCCGVGKKGWKKRFKDCVALVQHSISIANANTRQAHRAYGQVICRVLGWDITRLPSIVLSAGDMQPAEAQVLGSGLQSSSLANSNDGSNKTLQGNEDDGGKCGLSGLSNTTDTLNISNAELSEQTQSFSNENQQENGGGSTALEKNSPVEASVSNVIPETAKENTEDASNCPGNESDSGKNHLSGQTNTPDTVNIGSDETSQQKEPFGNENQQENGGGSKALEYNSAGEAIANEDVSNDIPEIAKENAEGAFNIPEPLPDDTIVANEENNRQKDDVSEETTIVSDMELNIDELLENFENAT